VRLDGKVALVTGAASGIGRVLALGLAAEGALVHVNDLEEPAEVHAALPDERRGLSLPCDVSDVAGIQAMFARLDRLDVLVNCAGIVGWTDVREPSEETWNRVLDTNLKGTFFCSVEAAKVMRSSGGGSIVNVSTVVAARGMRNMTPYAASKGGINALTIQLAVELAPDGIRVNAFAPGVVDTPMWIGLNEDIRAIHDQPAEADPMRDFATGTLIGRPASPDELAPFLVYLASPESDYMTGQMYMVDGGQVLV